jgi:FkbM family methyltransferase
VPEVIPNVFHFCYGFLPKAQFGFLEYLAVKSAYELNRPERMYLHYRHECSGPWWEKAVEMLTLNRVDPPEEIFGRKLSHFAHRSDVLRLQMLLEHGGIYMDIDTLCLRPFTPLLDQRCVMAWQSSRGLCNAVILSEPGGEFLRAWLGSYHTFRSAGRDQFWDEHSVVLPGRLARQRSLRPHVTLLSHRAFFFPLWDEMHHLFESNDPAGFKDSYCVHYCESVTRARWLSQITPENAVRGGTNFSRFVRRVLEGEGYAPEPESEENRPSSGLVRRAAGSLGTALCKVRWIDSLRHKVAWLRRNSRDIAWLPQVVRNLGVIPAADYVVKRLCLAAARPTKGPFLILRSKRAAHVLRCRGVDDMISFDRVFILREYACVDDADQVGLIVDCGARVGYASAYFLTRFPAAKVIALEPDPDNFAVLQANLAPYGERCQTVCAAVWSQCTRLVLAEPSSGEGKQWKRRVRPPAGDESPSVTAKDIGTLLEESGFPRISILRMNIGGAESTVLGADYASWIDKVDLIAVEPHGAECRSAFQGATAGGSHDTSWSGQVMIATRRPTGT